MFPSCELPFLKYENARKISENGQAAHRNLLKTSQHRNNSRTGKHAGMGAALPASPCRGLLSYPRSA
ncbi:hypothetical protein A3841_01225 [Pontibacter flavimaris]|uniref:Uncharacterized protein n=1 Tax=Pontibacter flavimaris TaxID=1797110 RepID=A0A1Q5PBJ1_9BACT|nr:hypothetical protein A3841_01225 [Pontibacter flavimaris]